MIRSASFALLALAAAGSVHAGTPIDEKRAVNADVRVEISNAKGSVTISGWDRNEVAISGELGSGARPTIEGGGAQLRIKIEAPDKQGWFSWGADSRMGPSELDIKVPKSAELKIGVVSADVTLSGVAGRLLDVDSVSGKLRLSSEAKEVDIDSVSGEVDIDGKAERARVQTVSGDIRARGLGGRLKYETVSGDIDADNARYSEINAGSVSGDIDLRGQPEGDLRIDVESMSGSVHLYLPEQVSTRLRASSFSGSIRSDFGTVKHEERGPGSSLDASSGNGQGQVKIETFSGDIDIRRR
jgi:DUF4097 and DUF4098 domain-containing protein YvlB